MNNLLQILVALLIALLVTVLAGPFFVDWNGYKREIEAEASRLVGRPLRVAGDVNLRLFPSPYLKLDDIRIDAPGNAPDKPALFEARAFRLWLAGPPLIRGAIEVEQIELIDPILRFLLDERGTSNWTQSNAAAGASALPFAPRTVSLETMKIVNGSIRLAASGTKQRSLDLTAIAGELSAGSLAGPYRFEGRIGTGSDERLLRFNSGRIDDKGELRLKAVLRSRDDGERYSFDGGLVGLDATPSAEGVVSAAFPFLELPAEGERPAQTEPLEVKTSLTADARQARFEQILVTLVHRNRPQMMTGNAQLNWAGGAINLDGKLQATLLDLDQLRDGLRVGDSVADIVGSLFGRIGRAAAHLDSGHFGLDLKQIKLNADLIQDVDFRLSRDAEGLAIERLAASLPGDNRLDIGGRLSGAAGNGFRGTGVLRGVNLGRLVTWGSGVDLDSGDGPIRARPFTLRGDIALDGAGWSLANARGDIADTAFSGAIALSRALDGKPGALSLQLTAGEIDTAAVFGRLLPMREIVDFVRTPDAASGAGAGAAPTGSPLSRLVADRVLTLQLRAGRVAFADLDGQDLVADLSYDLDRLDIRQLSVRSADGLRLNAEGRIEGIDTAPSGSLGTDIDIPTAAQLQRFIGWFGNDTRWQPSAGQLDALAPLRLAVTLRTEPGQRTAAVIRVNGSAGDSHVAFTNRLIGSNLFSRREALKIDQLEVTGSMSSDKGSRLLAQLLPRLAVADQRLNGLGAGKLWLSAAGLPNEGLASRLEFTTDRLAGSFDGRIGWQQGDSRLAGKLRLDTGDATLGFAVAGLDLPTTPGAAPQPLQLAAELDKKDATWLVTAIDGRLGAAELQGRGRLTRDGSGHRLELVLLASELDAATLVKPLLEGAVVLPTASGGRVDLATAEQATARVEQGVAGETDTALLDAVVSNRQFDPRLLDGLAADLVFTADRLVLADGIALKNGELTVKIDGHRIAIENIGGELWGGRMMARGTLDLTPSVPVLDGFVRIEQARLDAAPFRSEGVPVVAGKLDLSASFSGKGMSPAGMLAFLNGKGEAKLSDGQLNRFNPAAIDDTVEDELAAWDQSEDETPFAERFTRHLLSSDMKLAPIAQDFVIADGIVDFGVSQDHPGQSRVALDLGLALAPMNLTARLTMKPAADARNPNMPPVAVLYEGRLAGDAPIRPKADIASLEQTLKVMKLEHNVELLEKLHRQDEEIAQRAAEKRQQEAAEAAAAATAAPAAGSNGAATDTDQPPKSWDPFAADLNGMR